MDHATPAAIAEAAVRHGARSVAYTYNDPIIFAEYAIDTALACRERGVFNVAVTAGYIHAPPASSFRHGCSQRRSQGIHRGILFPSVRRASAAGARHARLDPPRERLLVEITTLLIPGSMIRTLNYAH